MANADLVPSLHPFQGSSQPMWLFLAEGGQKLIPSSKLVSFRRGCGGDEGSKCKEDEGHGKGRV